MDRTALPSTHGHTCSVQRALHAGLRRLWFTAMTLTYTFMHKSPAWPSRSSSLRLQHRTPGFMSHAACLPSPRLPAFCTRALTANAAAGSMCWGHRNALGPAGPVLSKQRTFGSITRTPLPRTAAIPAGQEGGHEEKEDGPRVQFPAPEGGWPTAVPVVVHCM